MLSKQSSILYKVLLGVIFIILLYILGLYSRQLSKMFPDILLGLGFFIVIFTLNEFLIFPRFYKTKAKFFYINLGLVLGLTLLHFAIVFIFDEFRTHEHGLPHHMRPPPPPDGLPHHMHRHGPPPPKPLISLLIISFSTVLLGASLSIIYLLTKELKSKAKNEQRLKEEKLETEIKLLKAQINPHFIFNALNNIYSLSYTQSKNAPDSVLKLSEMLRYVFNDCRKDRVSLGAEIKYISNFIAFQQMKSEHSQCIEFQFDGVDSNKLIAPMLFIPFIENSFKYSYIEEEKEAKVLIRLQTNENGLLFSIENSIPPNNEVNKGDGVGIKNVKKRLDLLYPNSYQLMIDDFNDKFVVNLKIDSI